MKRFFIRVVLLALAWAFCASFLRVPPSFQPWRVTFDFSRWELIQKLGPEWNLRHDSKFPAVGTASLVGKGSFFFESPSGSGAFLKGKMKCAHPGQQLILRLNGKALAIQVSHSPGTVERWRVPIASGKLAIGKNLLELENDDPKNPIEIEKLDIGNVKKRSPAIGAFLIYDVGKMERRQNPFSERRGIVLGLSILLCACLLSLLLSAAAHQVVGPVPSWQWSIPRIFLAGLTALVLWNHLVFTGIYFSEKSLLIGWGTVWIVPVGIRIIRHAWVRAHTYSVPSFSVRLPSPSVLLEWLLSGVGRAISLITSFGRFLQRFFENRWGTGLTLGSIFFIALWSRWTYSLLHPSQPIEVILSGADPEVYLQTSLEIARGHPFFLSLFRPPYFPLLGSVGNFQMVLCPFLAAFVRLWGFYPGFVYWVGTMIFGGSLLCLVPYLWQRQWGSPGMGGFIVGAMLASSWILREEIPRFSNDSLGTILLGVTYCALARLATKGRWIDAVVLGGASALLALSRSPMVFITAFMFASLGWLWIVGGSPGGVRSRSAKFALSALITMGILVGFDVACLSKPTGRSHLLFILRSHVNWMSVQGPLSSQISLASSAQRNISMLLETLWKENPLWVIVLPGLILFGIYSLWKDRSARNAPYLLAFLPWVGYLLLLLPGMGWPRYTLPWLLLEGLLIAHIVDRIWTGLTQRPTAFFSLFAAGLIGLFLLPIASTSAQSTKEWRAILQKKQQAREYLTWAKARLPKNAVVLVSSSVNPWSVSKELQRAVVYAGVTRAYGLLVNPASLHHHPFLLYPDATYSKDFDRFRHPTGRLFKNYLEEGKTLWVLDPAVDPEGSKLFIRECETGEGGLVPARYFQIESVSKESSWNLYRITHGPSK